ncbi:hypothetical protein RvY_06675 [Ramazzottius varieornatus]|uniref:WAP domain-containing protein n=1 Tax=Ramazzottius varieornatus TaxID=947166 RepID=A0A1D1UZT7_RAMVA|nr:hypothetical protein RvY_06675 [Ramazzottius varieornatus]
MSWFRLSCLTLLLVMLCLEITVADERKQRVRPTGQKANDGKKAVQATQKDKQKKPASGSSGPSAKGNARITLATRTTTTTRGPTTLRRITLSVRTVTPPPNSTPCACDPCNPIQPCCDPLDPNPCFG